MLCARSLRARAAMLGGGDHRCAVARVFASPPGRLLVVAAHPDDETIGIGATLGTLVEEGWTLRILHVTDGAPRNATLRPTLADRTVGEVAELRRSEVEAALRAGGLDPDDVLCPSLGFADQEATRALPRLVEALCDEVASFAPDVIVTHPYEGGHPDHDAVAFAVHAARPEDAFLLEMTSYHGAHGTLATGTFLDAGVAGPRCVPSLNLLGASARARKRMMLDTFETQRAVLAAFGDVLEPLRCAPPYDFDRPPHDGVLHYERLPFEWHGTEWRALAGEAWRGVCARRAETPRARP